MDYIHTTFRIMEIFFIIKMPEKKSIMALKLQSVIYLSTEILSLTWVKKPSFPVLSFSFVHYNKNNTF